MSKIKPENSIMPKRSNLFQRLVALLHENIDKNWTVIESEMLTNTLTGEAREVDIVCRSTLGKTEVIISIECTNTKRPASTTWIESMKSKHEFLPTSKLILWSGNGFYKPAIEFARKCGIETVTPQNKITEEWAKFANVFKEGTIKLIQPILSIFFDYENNEGEKCRLEGDINRFIRIADSGVIIPVSIFQYGLLTECRELYTVLLDHATEEKQDFWAKFEPGTKLEVQKEDGEWVVPFRIGFGIKTNTQQADIVSKSIKYGDEIFTLSSGISKKGPIELFVKETNPNELPPVKKR